MKVDIIKWLQLLTAICCIIAFLLLSSFLTHPHSRTNRSQHIDASVLIYTESATGMKKSYELQSQMRE